MGNMILNNYPFLNRLDVVVIDLRDYEPEAYCVFCAGGQGSAVRIDAFNVRDDQDGLHLPPDIGDPPIASTTLNLIGGGQNKFILRGGGGHPLSPATFQNRVTMITVLSGTLELDIASPTPFNTNLRQPNSSPINGV